MRTVTFENIYNKERFECFGKYESKIIDGIEYYRVFKPGTKREVYVRKDYLKKVK